jgi:hypothetical protein
MHIEGKILYLNGFRMPIKMMETQREGEKEREEILLHRPKVMKEYERAHGKLQYYHTETDISNTMSSHVSF